MAKEIKTNFPIRAVNTDPTRRETNLIPFVMIVAGIFIAVALYVTRDADGKSSSSAPHSNVSGAATPANAAEPSKTSKFRG